MLRSVTWQVGWLLWVIDEICHTLFMNWCILFIDGLSEEKHWYTSLQSDSQSELLFCKKRNNERSGFVLFSSHRTDKNHTSFKKFFISVLWSKNFPNLVPSFSISRLFLKKKKKQWWKWKELLRRSPYAAWWRSPYLCLPAPCRLPVFFF